MKTFTASDYLLKNNCFDNNKLQKRNKKGEQLFNSFEFSKNIILRTSSDWSE